MQSGNLTPQEAYRRLKPLFGEYHLQDDAARQTWMPDPDTGEVSGMEAYEAAYAEFRRVLDAPGTAALLDLAEQADLSARDRRNLQLMRYLHDIHVVEREVGHDYHGQLKRTDGLWKRDATTADWRAILPEFRHLVDLARIRAEKLGDQMGCTPYEALLREHDPDMTGERVDAWLGDIKQFARRAVQQAGRRETPPPPRFAPAPQERQEAFVRKLMASTGFDLDPARADVRPWDSPNTNSAYGRTFIGVPYRQDDPLHAVLAALHESGHGRHEQDANIRSAASPDGVQPVDRIINNMSLQEGHALLMEYMIGHNDAFAEYLADEMRDAYGDESITAEALMERMRRMRPSPIRRGSDPASYALHIVMRWEIERDLINGDLEVEDLPQRWKADVKRYFGADVQGPGDGWMQDPQWYQGSFGYWPSYAIGMCNAAVMYEALQRDIPGIDDRLRRGEFGAVNDWLRDNIYARGQEVPSHALMQGLMHGPDAQRPYTAPLLDIMRARRETVREQAWAETSRRTGVGSGLHP